MPQIRTKTILRKRLTEKLNAGVHRKLTLISASAGYGKTTIASEWITGCNRQAAWLSLDERDNEWSRFLAYLVGAFRKAADPFNSHALQLLQAPQPTPIETIISTLVSDLDKLPEPLVLVLDDYHVIHSKTVHEIVSFLIENLPSRMHAVILTREEPDLSLARLRIRDEVNDVGAADLRFTSQETIDFLNQVMELAVPQEAVSALEERMEGWAAGLQIAAASMKGGTEHKTLPQHPSFVGGKPLLLDYLVEEVLQKQSPAIQKFLLYTSILDRFCGTLCDAVLSDESIGSGEQILVMLERANLFLVPLDREQRWYRYHHLFGELLGKRLKLLQSTSSELTAVTELHLRASQWYQKSGLAMEAFRHAVFADDFEAAAKLAEGEGLPLHLQGEFAPVLSWLESLPKGELNKRPALWVLYGSALLLAGKPSDVESKLRAAEDVMKDIENEETMRKWMGMIAATRAAIAALAITGQPDDAEWKLHAAEASLQTTEANDKTNDLVAHILFGPSTGALNGEQLDTVISLSLRALEYLDPELIPVRLTALWLMGFAYHRRGDLNDARKAYTEVSLLSRKLGANILGIMATVGLGHLSEANHQLSEAEECYRGAIQEAGNLPIHAVREAYSGLARIKLAREQYEANTLANVEGLSPRELEILRLISQGLSNQEIGERLFLAIDTVKGHNRRIFEKLQVKRRTEAVAHARKLGWIE